MEAKEFEVEVVYRQRTIYRVRAADQEAAKRIGVSHWQNAEASAVAGYDWCEIESIHATVANDPEREEQDGELVLRFLKERERLIMRLGGGALAQSANDAISADQVASDLGWTRQNSTDGPGADVSRAARALEQLCREKKVVCFERPRVRTGERGEIRLYCTPGYLNCLSSELYSGARHADLT
ncbi:hypothetical protein BH23GEM6_BH23GEM6_00360 [soil metagenome]